VATIANWPPGWIVARQVPGVIEPPAERDELLAQEAVGPGPAGQPLHDRRVERGAEAGLGVGLAHHPLDEIDVQAEFSQPANRLAGHQDPWRHRMLLPRR